MQETLVRPKSEVSFKKLIGAVHDEVTVLGEKDTSSPYFHVHLPGDLHGSPDREIRPRRRYRLSRYLARCGQPYREVLLVVTGTRVGVWIQIWPLRKNSSTVSFRRVLIESYFLYFTIQGVPKESFFFR